MQAGCDGSTVETTFQTADPTYTPAGVAPLVAGDREGSVTAVGANAPNDAWAATTGGTLWPFNTAPNETSTATAVPQPPHLYQLTNGLAPQAPAGDDNDEPGRAVDTTADAPIVVIEPPAPAPVAVAVKVKAPPPRTKTLPPAVYDVQSHVVGTTLYLTFMVRRSTTLGAEAIHDGVVVATSGLHHFTPGTGQLVVPLSRSEWPTGLEFYTDLPTSTLANPGSKLSGTVRLTATASAYTGRHVVSVLFQYSPAGKDRWYDIATVKRAPWTTESQDPGRRQRKL